MLGLAKLAAAYDPNADVKLGVGGTGLLAAGIGGGHLFENHMNRKIDHIQSQLDGIYSHPEVAKLHAADFNAHHELNAFRSLQGMRMPEGRFDAAHLDPEQALEHGQLQSNAHSAGSTLSSKLHEITTPLYAKGEQFVHQPAPKLFGKMKLAGGLALGLGALASTTNEIAQS